jgi:hypothetical protein
VRAYPDPGDREVDSDGVDRYTAALCVVERLLEIHPGGVIVAVAEDDHRLAATHPRELKKPVDRGVVERGLAVGTQGDHRPLEGAEVRAEPFEQGRAVVEGLDVGAIPRAQQVAQETHDDPLDLGQRLFHRPELSIMRPIEPESCWRTKNETVCFTPSR